MSSSFSSLLRSSLILGLGLALAAGAALAQVLPRSSPFLPTPDTAGPSAPGAAKYQLSGVITDDGGKIHLSVIRVSDKQSFWIPLGETVNEITAVSYNAEQDVATLSANGERFTVSLRKPVVQGAGGAPAATVAAAGGTPVVSPPRPPVVGPPEVQEREARMLVTDLLEIGQENRKAYEEAQRKAAAEKKK